MNTTQNPPSYFDASQLAGLGIKPLASLLAHRRLAVQVFVLVLLLAVPMAWMKGKAHYSTSATVQIAPRYMKTLKDDNELDFQSNSQYRQFVEHQARSVIRYDIVRQALKNMGAQAKLFEIPQKTERWNIERLQERIVVIPVSDTYLMQISLKGDAPEGLAELLNTLVDVYLAQMKTEQMFGAEERVKKLQARELELLGNVLTKTSQRTALALELGVANFAQGDGNPFDKLLLATRASLAEARNARMAAQARLQAFAAHGETDITIRSITENILSDPGLNSLKASLNTRRANLLTSISGLTSAHPAYASAQQELQEIDGEIQKQTQNLKKNVEGSILARYKMSLEQAQNYENSLQNVLQEQQEQSATFAQKFNLALALSNDLAQYNKEIDSVRERLNFFAAEGGALGFVRKVTPALVPEVPFGPGRKKMLLFALFAALAAGVLAPIVRDLCERKIRTVNDAESVLKLPSLGWMIEKDSMATQIFAQDQLRRIAGGLMREQQRFATKVFAFCAVKPGAGNSQMCLDLAQVLTSLGYPTLVVEANAFRPDQRYASSAHAGLAQALTGTVALADCLLPASSTLPERVSVGLTAGTHLERLDQLPNVLAQWSEHYAFVLVDMPPLLLCADAEIMINRIGQIILVVEAGGINRGELGRAGRLLDKASVSSVGIIVNRVKALDGGGYLKQLLIEFLTQRKFSHFDSQTTSQSAWQGWLLQLANLRQYLTRRTTIPPEEK